MRLIFTVLHRWIGLAIAGFIVVSGLTGAVISWDHELDELLNAHITKSYTPGQRIPVLDLVKRVQEQEPKAFVTYFDVNPEEGHSQKISVRPRQDLTTGRLYELGYNQIFFDPVTGVELGRRNYGAAWPITRETFVSFLYQLHYMLHIPKMWGTDRWGYWLLGIVALIWTIDCFIGFYLTLPLRRARRANRDAQVERQLAKGWWSRWKSAWKIKTTGSVYRINFDVHRAFGLWTWALLFVIAFTGFSLNLNREVFAPAMALISKVTPSIWVLRTPTALDNPIIPKMDYPEIWKIAEAEGRKQNIDTPVGSLWYNSRWGLYGAHYFEPGDDHGAAGVGPAYLTFDAQDGRFLYAQMPWQGTAADIFKQAQFPLHSGRILGMPGRILISIMGLVSAALAVTGVVIWYRKRRARIRSQLVREAKGTSREVLIQG